MRCLRCHSAMASASGSSALTAAGFAWTAALRFGEGQEQVGDGVDLRVEACLPVLQPLPVEQVEGGMLERRRDGDVVLD